MNGSLGGLKSPQDLPCAFFMYWPQIWAGHVPPSMFAPKNIPFIEIRAEPGKPTHTAVESRGVKPTNHASMFLSVVPVLPPAGQPIWARVPVPARMLSLRILIASLVTPSENTFVRCTRQRAGSF